MLHLASGHLKRRKLISPPPGISRPTGAAMRLAIVHTLRSRVGIKGYCAADIGCGVGTVGLELLSNEASQVIFVERHARLIPILKKNVERLGFSKKSFILPLPVEHLPPPPQLDIVFVDPPYTVSIHNWIEALLVKGWLIPGTILVAQTPRKISWSPENWKVLKQRATGLGVLHFVQRKEPR